MTKRHPLSSILPITFDEFITAFFYVVFNTEEILWFCKEQI